MGGRERTSLGGRVNQENPMLRVVQENFMLKAAGISSSSSSAATSLMVGGSLVFISCALVYMDVGKRSPSSEVTASESGVSAIYLFPRTFDG